MRTTQGWFEVSNFNIDLDGAFSGVPGSPIGQPGKPGFSPLTLTLDSNTGLASLLALAATGQHLNGATLVGVTAGAQQDKVYQLDLADVLVTKVEDDAAAGLTLSLDYGKIELDTFTQNGTGGVVPEGQFGFDRPANTGGVTVPSVLPSGSVDPSPQPATYFMLIDGVNGGSTDAQHKGWFEITGVDLDLARMRLPAAGEANFSPLIVTPENEAALAGVMDLAATGGHVKGVHIEGFTGGTNPAEVYDLTLADVTVTRVADGEGDGYSLSLDYGKVALVTNGIDATGKPSQNGEFGYDVANKIEIAPFTLALNPGHAPVANAQSISTDEDTATAVTLSGSDADGDSLTFAVVSGPAHGTLSGSGANLTYTPDPDYNGPDAFTYVANDGTTDSEAANVSLTVQAAGIHIVKFVNGQDADSPTGPHVAAGSTVTFTYVVTNTGNVPLANVVVTDDKLGPITSFTGDTNGNGLLDLTETWTYTQTATALAGQQTNIGTVTGQDANTGTTVTDDNPANYFGDAPGIKIVKFVNGQDADSPTGPHVAAGSTVTFTYVVTNTGNVPLANVVVTDDKLGPITSFTGDTNGNGLLDLTETWTYTHDRHRPGRPADQRRHRHRPGRQQPRHHRHRRQPGQLLRRRPGDQHRQVRQRPGRRQPDRAARGRRQHGDLHLRGDQHRQRAPGQRRRHRRQAGPITSFTGDTNGNGLLDLTETWTYTRPPPPWPASRPTSAPSPARTPTARRAPPSPTTTRPTTSATPRRSTSSSSSTARTPTARPGRTWPPAAR